MALKLKELLSNITNNALFKNGGSNSSKSQRKLTQPVSLSYKNASGTAYRAIGAYSESGLSALTTRSLDDFIASVRYSSGAVGAVYLSPTYTYGSATIPVGTYFYTYMPHRNGGTNGSAQSDNCNYGSLILRGYLYSSIYILRFNNGSVAELHELDINSYRKTSGSDCISQYSNSYYSVTVDNCSCQGVGPSTVKLGLKNLSLYVQCSTVSSSTWRRCGTLKDASHRPTLGTNDKIYFSLTNSAATTLEGYINASGYIYCRGGYAGHGFQGNVSYF